MNCKNCGAKIKENAKVCQNCGAFCGDESEYVLLSDYDKMEDYYSNDNSSKNKKKNLTFFIVAVFLLAIIAGGAYYYFTQIYNNDADKPELNFTTGCGIINDDEKVIYVTVNENSRIEYIHGVLLYAYDKSDKTKNPEEAVSIDYEYTKNIDGTFRTIFFDTDDLDIKKNNDYIYTFEMNFSFYDSDTVYTYDQTIEFNGSITEDASDAVFDHSLVK